MKVALVLLSCVAMAIAFPQNRNADIQIVQQQSNGPDDGNYQYSYALSDGTNRQETGDFRSLGKNEKGEDTGIIKQTGSISWTSPEGQVFTLNYIADENGFRPIADHLPK